MTRFTGRAFPLLATIVTIASVSVGCSSGESNTPGKGGSTGSPGTAGSGVTGRGGGAGTSASAGTTGAGGSTGASAGTFGGAGTGAGVAGSGTSGGAGSGAAGTSGAAGEGGAAGTTGAGGGRGGTVGSAGANAGAGGRGGRGGTTGAAGTNAGTAGAAAGSSGSAGTTGTGGGGAVTCPSPAIRAGDTTRMVRVGSSNRSFILHVPSAYDGSKAVPLVVDFHPLGGSGSSERNSSPYPAQTDPEGVIMAFPTGLAGPSGGAWDVGPCCVANVDDVGFAKALVADIKTVACIDPKRVYAVGFSMGGGMSHYLACHAADVFAAVAPAAFDLLQENIGDCTPARPITVISFRSTGDPIVPYNGGASAVVSGMPVTFLGAKATLQKWAQLNQCTGAASAEDSNGCATYSTCQAGVEVALCTKQGGGHEAGNARVGWPVLKRHTLP